jgi:hypothetical protein
MYYDIGNIMIANSAFEVINQVYNESIFIEILNYVYFYYKNQTVIEIYRPYFVKRHICLRNTYLLKNCLGNVKHALKNVLMDLGYIR